MRHLLLIVSGSIAAYKAADLAHKFKKAGICVHVIMTRNAANFINPVTFDTLTGNRCITDTFDRNHEFNVEHVSLAAEADLVMVAPASADIIGKMANGIADDMATTTIMACQCPILLAPAMNTRMYKNPIVQANIKKLEAFGVHEIRPASGMLACGDVGEGKLPDVERLFDEGMLYLASEKDLKGKRVLVTAGPTEEAIDPVRFITNHSTGRMGYETARAAARRGADVTLISGPANLMIPSGIKFVPVTSASEMADECISRIDDTDIFVMTAAVADYTPVNKADQKIKKNSDHMTLELERTRDILKFLCANRRSGKKQFITGFAMETENLLDNARNKLIEKGADLICANSIRDIGAGFGNETNKVTLISRNQEEELPLMTKLEVADRIFDKAIAKER
jgi:phosphopantothenoylcysteine decarboxylase/phosphopantothenate--cysteine ligase